MAQLHRLVSARASHQATTPDEDALLYLCVFSLTLRADSEDNRNARLDRARLTIRLALVPYSTFAPFHFEINWSACPEARCGCCLCALPRAVVRLQNRLPLSPLKVLAHNCHTYMSIAGISLGEAFSSSS